ncbi:MAG: 50S ribosomal protein L32 [Planctomycetota bacterium]|nr:50S ribosomal protein L32 [Planctomycetota bacterium]
MAVPMRKISKRRTRMRASHHAISAKNLRDCARCGTPGPGHRVCGNCGHYRSREVVSKED